MELLLKGKLELDLLRTNNPSIMTNQARRQVNKSNWSRKKKKKKKNWDQSNEPMIPTYNVDDDERYDYYELVILEILGRG